MVPQCSFSSCCDAFSILCGVMWTITKLPNVEFIRCAYNGHSAVCKIPVLSLFLSLLKGQQRPGCHPTLPPCCDSTLLHLLSPTPIPPSGLPLPITYLSLGCLEVGTPIVNLNFNWVIPEKIHSPTTEGSVFWPPPLPPRFPKLLKPPSPQDFQVQRTPHPSGFP